MKSDGSYKLLLQSVDPENAAGIREVIQKLLGIGPGQANDIMDSAPIILLDGVASRKKADRIKEKFKEAADLGAEVTVSDEPLENTPRLRWPEEPEIARDKEKEKPEGEEGEVLTLAKYNFVIDRRDVFHCPHCDKLFLLKELNAEDAQEATAQAEIAQRLQKKEKARPAAAPQPQPVAVPGQGVEEVEPIQDSKAPAGRISTPDPELMDLATFEEGLSSLDYEGPGVPELALPPEEPVSTAEKAQDFFQELESLPVEGTGKPEPASAVPEAEAVQKESELEELHPEEAMKFFEGRRAKTEEQPEEEKKKVVAPRRGAAKRRMQRLRGKQEEKEEGRKKPSGRRRRAREEPEEEEAPPEIEHTEGFHGVVLSRIGSREKKNNAAKLIIGLVGAHPEEARDMVEGIFVNVIRGISEEEANEVAEKFREIGVSAKVTFQKRKMRKSGRMKRK